MSIYLKAAELLDARKHCTSEDCGHPACAIQKAGGDWDDCEKFYEIFDGQWTAVSSVDDQKAAVLQLCLMAEITR